MRLNNINKMAFFYTACAVRVTIFSTGGKIRSVSIFTWLHTLTQVAHSYTLFGLYKVGTQSSVLSNQVLLFQGYRLREGPGYVQISWQHGA